jgi:arylsulfatase
MCAVPARASLIRSGRCAHRRASFSRLHACLTVALRALRAQCLVHMDVVFGRLMAALEASGQARNTLVFVSSDNGPNMETWPDAGRTPFRGSKGSTWEGGVRVPGIAYWPSVIAPGRRSDGAFDLMDLYATAATLAGVPDAIPHDRFIDAIDQTGFLLADEGLSARKWVYYWMQETFSGVRVAEHKLLIAATYWEYMQDAVLPGGLSGDITTYENGHFFKYARAPRMLPACCRRCCAATNDD